MSLPQKYYEELIFTSQDNRELLPRNQNVIIELLEKNGAVGVFGVYDEPGYPIYFISGFALTAIGCSYEEMLEMSGGKFINLVFEKDRDVFTAECENPDLVSHEYRMIHKSGKNVWVSSYRKRSTSMEDRPIIIASVRVVEDARKRESELLDALTRGYNGIIYIDVNQKRYRIIKHGDGFPEEQMTGTIPELEEMLRQYERDFVNPDDKAFGAMLDELDLRAARDEKRGNYQTTYHAMVDGRYQWVQFQAIYGGTMNLETGHIILAFRVVDTERRLELDKNKILSDLLEKAEKAVRVKDDFLSRMSHDLRTPLNGITGMLEIAREYRDDPARIEECLDKIAVSCDNLMSLVQNVLDMDTLEHGEAQLEEESFDLSGFLTEKLHYISEKASRLGLTYIPRIETPDDRELIGSPKQLLQILDHLLDNAVKYNKPGGSVTLLARRVSESEKVAVCEFVVEDTGLGMAPEFVDRIFELFEQEMSGARTAYMGTGLGMPIVKKLVEQMNGTILVESTQGKGTKITVTIPFKISENKVCAQPDDIAPIDLTKLKVLLVEDNLMNLEIAEFLLESAGMTVVKAMNGQEAVDAFRQSEVGEFSVVLMDILMPVMDGLEATRQIRRLDRPDAKKAAIIAVSANVLESDIKQSKMAGLDEHLSKPIDRGQLLEAITKCLRAKK